MSCIGVYQDATRKCPCSLPKSLEFDHQLSKAEEKHHFWEKEILDTIYEWYWHHLGPLWNPQSEAHWIRYISMLVYFSPKGGKPSPISNTLLLSAARHGQAMLLNSKILRKIAMDCFRRPLPPSYWHRAALNPKEEEKPRQDSSTWDDASWRPPHYNETMSRIIDGRALTTIETPKEMRDEKRLALHFLGQLFKRCQEEEKYRRQKSRTYKIHALECDYDLKLEPTPKSAAGESDCSICKEPLCDHEDMYNAILKLIGQVPRLKMSNNLGNIQVPSLSHVPRDLEHSSSIPSEYPRKSLDLEPWTKDLYEDLAFADNRMGSQHDLEAGLRDLPRQEPGPGTKVKQDIRQEEKEGSEANLKAKLREFPLKEPSSSIETNQEIRPETEVNSVSNSEAGRDFLNQVEKDGRSFAKTLWNSYRALKKVIEEDLRCVQPVKLRCGHIVGFDCLERWLLTVRGGYHMSTCPTCRARLKGSGPAVPYPDPEPDPERASSSEREMIDPGNDGDSDVVSVAEAPQNREESPYVLNDANYSFMTLNVRTESDTTTSQSSSACRNSHPEVEAIDPLVITPELDTITNLTVEEDGLGGPPLDPPPPSSSQLSAFPRQDNWDMLINQALASLGRTKSTAEDQSIPVQSLDEIGDDMGESVARQPAGNFQPSNERSNHNRAEEVQQIHQTNTHEEEERSMQQLSLPERGSSRLHGDQGTSNPRKRSRRRGSWGTEF